MKIPLSWLKERIELELPAEEIAEKLTMLGIEVEGIDRVPWGFEAVVVGHVLSVERHPNADKLSLATVSDGKAVHQVVCGASNCRAGLKTAFAKAGATLLDDHGKPFLIKPVKIRGVESFGMLCSLKELHLSDTHEGILELPDATLEGTPLSDLYADTVLSIALTPNLNHCSSIWGIARELSAATKGKLTHPDVSVKENLGTPTKDLVRVTIKDPENCPRYAARLIRGVKIGPSPTWLQKRLEICDIRSVNNIVDITNYVLLELGQPLHAFDFEKIGGGEIIVRKAVVGETLVTLDGKERKLAPHHLVIADSQKPIALAGVMGGKESEISDKTTTILLESAYFRSTSVRKTSRELALLTEGSKRFERGTDPNAVVLALEHAAALIQELAGGTIASGVIDIKDIFFEKKEIICRLDRINNVLGTHLSANEVEDSFRRLHFDTSWDGQNSFTVQVPTYRGDITTEIDLMEEAARLYGYDNFVKAPTRYHASTMPHAPLFLFERDVIQHLVGEGLQQFLTCDLIGPTLLSRLPTKTDSFIRVKNSVSTEQSILRTSLLPALLQVVKDNVSHQNHNICGFEVGKIHFKQEERYHEQAVVGIILAGNSTPQHWDVKAHATDFYDLKGIVENLLEKIGVKARFGAHAEPIFHPGRQAAIQVGLLRIGTLGEIHPDVVHRLDVPQRLYYAELNLHDLFPLRREIPKLQPLALYPGSERDWTITLKEDAPQQEVLDLIQGASSTLLKEALVLDIYRSDKLGKDKKNVTFRFLFRDTSKTLSQEEVDVEHERVTHHVLTGLGKKIL